MNRTREKSSSEDQVDRRLEHGESREMKMMSSIW